MCGRFALGIDYEAITNTIGITNSVVYRPRFNVAPSDMILVMSDWQKLEFKRWGLVAWCDANPLINARFETIQEKPSFANAYKRNRCVILSSGYYEWAKVRGEKQPFYIFSPEQPLLLFAGIYNKDTCAVITVPANKKLSNIHQRMPLTLSLNDAKSWLSRKRAIHTEFILDEKQKTNFNFYKVNKRVNYPSYDYAECIEPL